MRLMIRTSFAIALVCMSGADALAQTAKYPAKVVRVIVGFAAGGAVDVQARVVAQRLTETLGQSVLVENRPGADGILAGDFVAKAPPDGYTVAYVSAGHAMNSILHAKTLPYDPIRDFAPVSLVASGPLTLVVNRALPVNGLKELVALAKAKPGQLNLVGKRRHHASRRRAAEVSWRKSTSSTCRTKAERQRSPTSSEDRSR